MKKFILFILGAISAAFAFGVIYILAEVVIQKTFFRSDPQAPQIVNENGQAVTVTKVFKPGTFSYVTDAKLTPLPPRSTEYTPRAPGSVKYTFTHKGSLRTWYGMGRRKNTPAAVVVLLHGAKRNGLSMLDMWQDVSRRNNVVLIAPDSFGAGWDENLDGDDFLSALIENAQSIYRIDPEKIYLFGHSAGAIFAQNLANKSSLEWRAVGAHAGTPYWRDFTEKADAPPVRIYLGSRDHNFPMGQAVASAQKLAENGHDVEFIEIPNHTHWFYIIGRRLSQETWQFFASK